MSTTEHPFGVPRNASEFASLLIAADGMRFSGPPRVENGRNVRWASPRAMVGVFSWRSW
jgi:hypothetical protein